MKVIEFWSEIGESYEVDLIRLARQYHNGLINKREYNQRLEKILYYYEKYDILRQIKKGELWKKTKKMFSLS